MRGRLIIFCVSLLLFMSCLVIGESSNAYCFKPCVSRMIGHLKIKNITLRDPKMEFVAYMLMLDRPASVSGSGEYEGVSNASLVQLEFVASGARKKLVDGSCVMVSGELAGAMTAYDVSDLVMQVDAISRCK